MKVILRPIRRDSWSGLKKYKNCYEDVGPYLTRSGRSYTGLLKDEATRLGEVLGLDLGPGSEFWRDYFIRTSGKDIYLDTSDPADELKYLYLKGHKNVKNSLSERKATARFVLINKGEEDKRTNVFNRMRRKATRSFDDMNLEDMRKCLRIFGHNGDRLSNEAVENKLFDIVEGDPISFLKKWVDNDTRDTEALIEKALSRNIIRRNKNIYKYGSDVIGHTIAETIDFLNDPKNQEIKIAILKQMLGKESLIDTTSTPEVDDKYEILEEKKPIRKKQLNFEEVEEEVKAKTSKILKGDTI